MGGIKESCVFREIRLLVVIFVRGFLFMFRVVFFFLGEYGEVGVW